MAELCHSVNMGKKMTKRVSLISRTPRKARYLWGQPAMLDLTKQRWGTTKASKLASC